MKNNLFLILSYIFVLAIVLFLFSVQFGQGDILLRAFPDSDISSVHEESKVKSPVIPSATEAPDLPSPTSETPSPKTPAPTPAADVFLPEPQPDVISVPQDSSYHEKVPILMYHQVDDAGTNSLYLSVADFISHLDYFSEAGITPITMHQLISHWKDNTPLPSKPIVLTFDDGYLTMYKTVFPLLSERGWPGTFYCISNWIGGDELLSSEMISEMANAGMEIGSHSAGHVDLSRCDAATLNAQVSDSKSALESIIDMPVLQFCYPSGAYNNAAAAAVASSGYESSVTTEYGFAEAGQGFFSLKRIRISLGNDAAKLKELLGGLGY